MEDALAKVRDFLDYDPDAGIFHWKSPPTMRPYPRAGDRAGNVNHRGYRRIQFRGRYIQEHRLAWYFAYGRWPTKQIDHRDGNKVNNAISNLREATPSQNKMNSPKRKDVPFKGVTFLKRQKKFQAQIQIDRKTQYLGSYTTAEEAHAAYCDAARRLFGEFARFE